MNLPSPLWLAGATGLVGRALLKLLLNDDGKPEVHALLRRKIENAPKGRKLHQHLVDFANLSADGIVAPKAVFICLGTTIKQAGSQQAFRAVDFDAVLAVAKAARQAGAEQCAVVSAMGANALSPVFYNRVKGETEQALKELGFARLVIARPSLLIGDRTELGQPTRPGEVWGERIARPLMPLIPSRWRPIEAETVARAMATALATEGPQVQMLESDALQRLGRAA